jgi:hypothetical protein
VERRLYNTEKLRLREARREAARDPARVLLAKVERATIAALRRYIPSPFAGRVKIISPNKAWLNSAGVPLQWRSVAQYTEELFGPDGCQATNMLLEPYALAIAELFRRCREKSEIKVAPWNTPTRLSSPGRKKTRARPRGRTLRTSEQTDDYTLFGRLGS